LVRARVLVIGGLDPSGGAGITADARTLLAHGCDALAVAAAITVQNRRGMQKVECVDGALVRDQIRAAIDDGAVAAIKIGLLGSAAMVERVAEWTMRFAPETPRIVDPVLSATAGGYDAGRAVADAYRHVLAPRASLFTPNLPELAAISPNGGAAALLADGCDAALIKGGHGDGEVLVDTLIASSGTRTFLHMRKPVGRVHGTGCALASAIAAHVARGAELAVACESAIAWLQRCLAELPPALDAALPRPLPIVVA
jgi:hydroxymethylpyrimidine/phosphomethylpyrimidine kinase